MEMNTVLLHTGSIIKSSGRPRVITSLKTSDHYSRICCEICLLLLFTADRLTWTLMLTRRYSALCINISMRCWRQPSASILLLSGGKKTTSQERIQAMPLHITTAFTPDDVRHTIGKRQVAQTTDSDPNTEGGTYDRS